MTWPFQTTRLMVSVARTTSCNGGLNACACDNRPAAMAGGSVANGLSKPVRWNARSTGTMTWPCQPEGPG